MGGSGGGGRTLSVAAMAAMVEVVDLVWLSAITESGGESCFTGASASTLAEVDKPIGGVRVFEETRLTLLSVPLPLPSVADIE